MWTGRIPTPQNNFSRSNCHSFFLPVVDMRLSDDYARLQVLHFQSIAAFSTFLAPYSLFNFIPGNLLIFFLFFSVALFSLSFFFDHLHRDIVIPYVIYQSLSIASLLIVFSPFLSFCSFWSLFVPLIAFSFLIIFFPPPALLFSNLLFSLTQFPFSVLFFFLVLQLAPSFPHWPLTH